MEPQAMNSALFLALASIAILVLVYIYHRVDPIFCYTLYECTNGWLGYDYPITLTKLEGWIDFLQDLSDAVGDGKGEISGHQGVNGFSSYSITTGRCNAVWLALSDKKDRLYVGSVAQIKLAGKSYEDVLVATSEAVLEAEKLSIFYRDKKSRKNVPR